jgi:hypothetical protein
MTGKVFDTLFHLDVNSRVEKKKTGNTQLSYLSWAWAWAEVKKRYPEAVYKIAKFENNLPYVYDPNTGYMVFTEVTIENVTHEMWLPVMDGANNAMKSEPYEYQVIKWTNGKRDGFTTKSVEPATMFDINKTIMRCLVKNLAMFGLGLYIYSGEDLPEAEPPKPATPEQTKALTALIEELAELSGKTYESTEKAISDYLKLSKKLKDIDSDEYGKTAAYINKVLPVYKKKAEEKKRQEPEQTEQSSMDMTYNIPEK